MKTFVDIYEEKKLLTNKIANIFFNQNRRLLGYMSIETEDIIQMFLIKFFKYTKESFLKNCQNNKYWVTLCLMEFRKLMLQEHRKQEYKLNKVDLIEANNLTNEENEDYSEYDYLKELIKNKETALWLLGYTKTAISEKLYGQQSPSRWTIKKITNKINEDILNIQEHLGIEKKTIINEVYKLQDKVIRLHIQGLRNFEIAEKLNKTNKQIDNIIYHARKSGKLEKENSVYYKRKLQILSFIKENKDWTYYKVRTLFKTDTATIKRYLKEMQDETEIKI